MLRFAQFFAVAGAALFLAWSTSEASAQCYQQPFYGGRTGHPSKSGKNSHSRGSVAEVLNFSVAELTEPIS